MSTGISSGARSLILGRIRDILGERPVAAATEHQSIARDYRQSSSLGDDDRVALLIDRLQHYQVGVHRCEAATLAATIQSVLATRHKTRLVVPVDVPRDWLPQGVEFVPDTALSYADLDRSEGVLTGCSAAMAATGTLVLRHLPREGRRALTLVPDYHLCVLHRGQIVETVPEAFTLLGTGTPELVTTISGPSATADIEMTRVRGVHGPRTLDVVLVG